MSDRLGRNILMIAALAAFTLADAASGTSQEEFLGEEDIVEEDVLTSGMVLVPPVVNAEVGDEFVVAVLDPSFDGPFSPPWEVAVERWDEPLELVETDFSVTGDIFFRCAGEGEGLNFTVSATDGDEVSATGTVNCRLPDTAGEEVAEDETGEEGEETGVEEGGTEGIASEGIPEPLGDLAIDTGWFHPDGSSMIFFADGEIDVTTPDGEEATGTFEVSGTTITIDVAHPLWEECPPEPATFDWFINEVDGWLQLSPHPGDCFAQLAFFARGDVGPDEERVWFPDDESGPVVEAQGGTIGFTQDLSDGTCPQYASSYSQTVELTAHPAPGAPGQWIFVMVNPESGQAVQSDPWDPLSNDPVVMVFDGPYSERYTLLPDTGNFDYDYTDENGQDCAWMGEIPDSQEFQDFDDFMGALGGG